MKKEIYLFVFCTALIAFAFFFKKLDREKFWMNHEVDLNQLTERTDTYHMFNSKGVKVGSMIFGWKYKDGFLIARDTSQFDDGSIYETVELVMDTSDFQLKSIDLDIKMPTAELDIDFKNELSRVTGTYKVTRNGKQKIENVDSVFIKDIFREEIYMLLHAIDLSKADTMNLKALVTTVLGVVEGQIYYEGTETLDSTLGRVKCDVFWLAGSGGMPSNRIWIGQNQPRQMIRFHVPDSKLTIELVSSTESHF